MDPCWDVRGDGQGTLVSEGLFTVNIVFSWPDYRHTYEMVVMLRQEEQSGDQLCYTWERR